MSWYASSVSRTSAGRVSTTAAATTPAHGGTPATVAGAAGVELELAIADGGRYPPHRTTMKLRAGRSSEATATAQPAPTPPQPLLLCSGRRWGPSVARGW